MLGELAGRLGLQYLDCAHIEGDDPSPLGRLGLAEDDLAARGDQGATHRESGCLQIDVLPAQPQGLAAPHAGQSQQVPEAAVALFLGRPKEGLQLRGAPGPHLMGATPQARRVGGIGWIAHQAAPAYRVAQGAVQTAVHVMDRHGGEATLAVLAPRGGELGIEAVEGGTAQPLQLHGTDEGHDVAVHMLDVGVVGRRSHGRLSGRQPLLPEVLPDRQPGRCNEALFGDRDQQAVHRLGTLLAGGETRLGGAAALVGLDQGPAAARAGRPGLAFDPEASPAVLAALRRRCADVDDVLEAGLAPSSDVALRAVPLMRVCTKRHQLRSGGQHSKGAKSSQSTGRPALGDQFGAVVCRQPGGDGALCSGLSNITGQGDLCVCFAGGSTSTAWRSCSPQGG